MEPNNEQGIQLEDLLTLIFNKLTNGLIVSLLNKLWSL